MSEEQDGREQDRRRADQATQGIIAGVAHEMMSKFNRDKKDPADYASHGHDTARGFEFFIERHGMVIKVELSRDLDT